MKRSTFILGFALLVVAVTLATTITVRNDPGRVMIRPKNAPNRSMAVGRVLERANQTERSRPVRRQMPAPDRYEVTIPVEAIADRPPAEQAELHLRAESVQRTARRKLERMTGEFALSRSQRARMFPMLARSTRDYDPVMQVGGVQLAAGPVAPADEEMHDLLDPDQRTRFEDKELDRQLWWEDLFARIDAELIDSTGGMPIGEPAADQTTNAGERTAPTSRGRNTR